jgi:RimJ/RimL family protein N-acetyltransferase
MTVPRGQSAVLETPRLVLRRPRPADAEGFIGFLGSERAVHLGGPMARPAAWRVFATVLGHWEMLGFGLWAVCRHGSERAVATVGLLRPEGWPEGEIAWHVLDPSAEGAGIAFEAAEAARAHAYEVLGWPGAVSYIAPANARSIRLAERLGAVADAEAPVPEGLACTAWRHPGPEALAEGGMEAYA